ncbi:hypothetical protein HDV05_005806 [Chytridiales sp. JEL 0842]|nr:hypothetical protein HDV05_005806 [Chytridiales sp. JEL 0842]
MRISRSNDSLFNPKDIKSPSKSPSFGSPTHYTPINDTIKSPSKLPRPSFLNQKKSLSEDDLNPFKTKLKTESVVSPINDGRPMSPSGIPIMIKSPKLERKKAEQKEPVVLQGPESYSIAKKADVEVKVAEIEKLKLDDDDVDKMDIIAKDENVDLATELSEKLAIDENITDKVNGVEFMDVQQSNESEETNPSENIHTEPLSKEQIHQLISNNGDPIKDDSSHQISEELDSNTPAQPQRSFILPTRRRRQIDMSNLTGLSTMILQRLEDLQTSHNFLLSPSSTPSQRLTFKSDYLTAAHDIITLGHGIATAWKPVATACTDKRLSDRLTTSLSKLDTLSSHMKVIVKMKSYAEDRDVEGLVLVSSRNVVEAAKGALEALESAKLRLDEKEGHGILMLEVSDKVGGEGGEGQSADGNGVEKAVRAAIAAGVVASSVGASSTNSSFI